MCTLGFTDAEIAEVWRKAPKNMSLSASTRAREGIALARTREICRKASAPKATSSHVIKQCWKSGELLCISVMLSCALYVSLLEQTT
jgi:hypothetical protein